MDWKKISSKEWVFFNVKTNRIVTRIKKEAETFILYTPSGATTENAFLTFEDAKVYVEKYHNQYGTFLDWDRPLR